MQLDYAPGMPSKTVGGRELSPAEYDHYLELAGKGSYSALSPLVRSPEWKALDDEGKIKAARKAVADARRDARAKLSGAGPAANDPWAAFPEADGGKAAPDPWASFPSADKRDVQAELSNAIPGVRFTSGYRDKAYNASLRARGYHPSHDSEHLDGAALDMLPPPGKSLA